MEENNYILPEIPQQWVWTQLDILGKGDNAIVDGPFGSNLKTSDYINDSVNGVAAAIAPSPEALASASHLDAEKWELERKRKICGIITELLKISKRKIWL
jgi:hypothetical protein